MNSEKTDASMYPTTQKLEESSKKSMTFLSTLLAFFPALVMLMVLISFLWICSCPNPFSVTVFLFFLYAFPVFVYRIHHHFYPIQEGISYLCGTEYSPWWGSHQIQVIYITFPFLEAALRLIPGVFSLWLRLWGSKVGQNVYWTPQLEIADRGLLEIGDRVVFGHAVGMSSHVIKPKKNDLMLYVKKIRIGNDVFLGAKSGFSPGVTIENETFVPVFTQIHPNKIFGNDSDIKE
jgi:hypothetical protein